VKRPYTVSYVDRQGRTHTESLWPSERVLRLQSLAARGFTNIKWRDSRFRWHTYDAEASASQAP
jgi:hypothetical protein